jgi:hypothetical protein
LYCSNALSTTTDITRESDDAVARPHLDPRYLQPAIGTNPVLYFRNDLCSVSGNDFGFAAVSGMETV